MLVALALAFTIAHAAPPPAANLSKPRTPKPLGVIIWAGGSSKAAGEAALADAKKNLPKDIVLAPGYPKLVESKDVPGLKPGFHVAVVGVCTASKGGAVVSRLRESKDGVYQRRVAKHPSPLLALACPTIPKRAPDTGPVVKLGSVDVTLVTAREDSCADLPEPTADEEPRACNAEETMMLVAMLDGARTVLWEQTVLKSSSDVECDVAERWDGPSVVDDAPVKGERLPRITFEYSKEDGCAGVYAPAPTAEEIEAEAKENSVLLRFDGTQKRYVAQ